MTKYQQYFQDMIESHHKLFDAFKEVHDKYTDDPDHWQEQFNEEGEKVMAIIRRYENMLCGRSEGTGYGKYSSKLSEKFWEAVRRQFPKIDFVGMQ